MKVIKAEDTRSLEPFRDRIIEGDCLEVMKGIPGESIDMILCDLPYGTTQNKWDSIIDLDLLFAQYMRIIKPHGAIVLTSSGLFTAKLMLHAPEIYKSVLPDLMFSLSSLRALRTCAAFSSAFARCSGVTFGSAMISPSFNFKLFLILFQTKIDYKRRNSKSTALARIL